MYIAPKPPTKAAQDAIAIFILRDGIKMAFKA
ncbi:hypothetical protein FHR55_001993 [Xanthomonas arboricola]